jgi:hypothetical protein
MSADTTDVSAIIDAELDRNGVSVVRVSDGHVFTFTLAALHQLAASAEAKGSERVMLFVQRGPVN